MSFVSRALPDYGREGGKVMGKAFAPFMFLLCAFWAQGAKAKEPQTYIVQRGDRFEELARRFLTTPEEIRAANPRAFGIRCLRPFTREGRDGKPVAYCGRPRYYLIAGAAIVVPESRALVGSENFRLAAENTVFEAERDQARNERDLLEEERDALRAERDRLAEENEKLLRSQRELQCRYDALKSHEVPEKSLAPDYPTPSENSRGSDKTSGEKNSFVDFFLVLGVVLVVVISFYLTRSSRRNEKIAKQIKKEKEEIAQDRAHLEVTRSQMVKEGLDLAERKHAVSKAEADLGRQKADLDSLAERKSVDYARRDETLADREKAVLDAETRLIERESRLVADEAKPRMATAIGVPPPIFPPGSWVAEKNKAQLGVLQVFVSRGLKMVEEEKARLDEAKQRLAEEGRTLAGREAACTAREKSIGRRTEALDSLRLALDDRERTVAEKEHGVEELRKALSSGKARCDRTDIDQTEREENLVRAFADLAEQKRRLSREFDAREENLSRRQAEVDGRIRMYDQDIAPELARREAALSEAERILAEKSAESDRRAKSLDSEERDYERRLQELRNFEGDLEKKAEQIVNAQSELEEERKKFGEDLAKAKNVLSRSRRKKQAIEELDERAAALDEKEKALAELAVRLDDRAANLGIYAERLDERARELGVGDDVPTIIAGGEMSRHIEEAGITHVDPPGSEPAMPVDSADIEGETEMTAGTLSRCFCPQCGKQFPWEDIETHECGEKR